MSICFISVPSHFRPIHVRNQPASQTIPTTIFSLSSQKVPSTLSIEPLHITRNDSFQSLQKIAFRFKEISVRPNFKRLATSITNLQP